jgi:hypothetical protein
LGTLFRRFLGHLGLSLGDRYLCLGESTVEDLFRRRRSRPTQ